MPTACVRETAGGTMPPADGLQQLPQIVPDQSWCPLTETDAVTPLKGGMPILKPHVDMQTWTAPSGILTGGVKQMFPTTGKLTQIWPLLAVASTQALTIACVVRSSKTKAAAPGAARSSRIACGFDNKALGEFWLLDPQLQFDMTFSMFMS